MNIIYVDDERNALINFEYEINSIDNTISYKLFLEADEAVEYVRTNKVDVAFLDMKLRDRMGTELAIDLQGIKSDIIIVYVSAYPQYTLEAYKTKGRAYLLKPYTREELAEVISFLNQIFGKRNTCQKKIFIKTFGSFDIFIAGQPVLFHNAKAKELLALLVDMRGGVLTNEEIFTYLWEGRNYTKTTSTYVRKAIHALRVTLEENECEELVSFNRNSLYINYSLFKSGYFKCDVYSVLEGENHYIDEYSGSYMSRYSWAEDTIYLIENKIHGNII